MSDSPLDKPISQLPLAGALSNSDFLVLVQGQTTDKTMLHEVLAIKS